LMPGYIVTMVTQGRGLSGSPVAEHLFNLTGNP